MRCDVTQFSLKDLLYRLFLIKNNFLGDLQDHSDSPLGLYGGQNSSSRIAYPLTVTILVTLAATFLTSVL